MSNQEPVQIAEPLESQFDPEDLIGDTLAGRYDVEERIGKGGMGVVYLASQSALNRKVVVKVLAKGLSDEDDDGEAIQRFEREALGLSQLQHPNIVTIFDFGRDRDIAYIVMEYVEGETLSQCMRRTGPMGFEEFAKIATQILDALSEAHSRGIIHRDIKPSNIMLCERHGNPNFVKVLDFGLAKLVHDAAEVTKKQNLVGSVAFLAPEQILGLDFDQRVDVYALGVLFYYMLAGQKPFRGEDDISVLYQHIHKNPTPLHELLPPGHDIPEEAIQLIHLCLDKDPKERPKDARDLLNRLQTDMSRSIFQMPWGSGEFSAATLQTPHSGVMTPSAQHMTPHSGVVSMSPSTDLSGQYSQVSQMSGLYAVQQQPNRTPLYIALALVFVLGAGLVAFIVTSNGSNTDGAVPQERLVEILDDVDGLVAEQRWGQAQTMLDSVQRDLKAHPELIKRSAAMADSISVGKLMQQAEIAEEQRDFQTARARYNDVLSRAPAHEEATAKLAALPKDVSAEAPAEVKLGRVKVDAPIKARVTIDGSFVGYTPLEHDISPDQRHEVEVQADGYVTWTNSVQVAAGGNTVLDAKLQRAVAASSKKTSKPVRKKTKTTPRSTSSSGDAAKQAGAPATKDSGKASDDKAKKKDGLIFPVDKGAKKPKKRSNDLLPIGN